MPPPCPITAPVAGEPFIVIHTDGSCLGNPGPGGWAAVLRRIDGAGRVVKRLEISGADPATTNNRMELTAAIRGLQTLKRSVLPVVVVSDSGYVRGGITEWLPKWKANGWRTSARKPVLNAELWRELEEIAGTQRIDWRWTRGHAGDPMNEKVDGLARRAAELQREAAGRLREPAGEAFGVAPLST